MPPYIGDISTSIIKLHVPMTVSPDLIESSPNDIPKHAADCSVNKTST